MQKKECPKIDGLFLFLELFSKLDTLLTCRSNDGNTHHVRTAKGVGFGTSGKTDAARKVNSELETHTADQLSCLDSRQ